MSSDVLAISVLSNLKLNEMSTELAHYERELNGAISAVSWTSRVGSWQTIEHFTIDSKKSVKYRYIFSSQSVIVMPGCVQNGRFGTLSTLKPGFRIMRVVSNYNDAASSLCNPLISELYKTNYDYF